MTPTIGQVKQIFPFAKPGWVEAFVAQVPKIGIDTPEEAASFCSQIGQESCGLTAFEENLNYTPDAIITTFNAYKPRFTREQAALYGRTAEHPADQAAIANVAYAGRLGNGSAETGDGYFYRGRGPIQVTFHDNYLAFEQYSGHPVTTKPDLLLNPDIGMECACWYWKIKGMDKIDDDNDIVAETKLVTGGAHGLTQRQKIFVSALAVFQGA